MKHFTSADIDRSGSLPRLYCEHMDIVVKMLPWQQRGLQQTASGYGRKLTTSGMIHFNGKLRRIYCCCISNAGSCYIVHEGKWLFIDGN